MSTVTEGNPRLLALTEAGVSVWFDQIRRGVVASDELARMVTAERVSGVTSNPSIFEQAILGSGDYDQALASLARERLDALAIYERLALGDVQAAADALAEIHRASDGRDGFVSLSVSPELAYDTEATLAQARFYWQRLGRPNAMIKIPATREGIRATEEALFEGINVNLTLLFSVSTYERGVEAYLRALERRLEDGLALDVNSVASFFLSPMDAKADLLLASLGRDDLRGRAAIAGARAAYRRFEEIFHEPRWNALRHAGGAVQRPLWASTTVKDPDYRDTLYVEELVGRHVVITMAPKTVAAVAGHGRVRGPTAQTDPTPDLDALRRAGIYLDRVADELLAEGVQRFTEAHRRLLAGIEKRRHR